MQQKHGSEEGLLPRNVVVSIDRLRAVDPVIADEFAGLMLEAAGLAKRSTAIRRKAWDLFHENVSDD